MNTWMFLPLLFSSCAIAERAGIRLPGEASIEAPGDHKSLGRHRRTVSALCFSPDGKHVASGGEDNLIKLWAVEGDEGAREFKCKYRVKGLTFTKDGKTLLSAEQYRLVRWDMEKGETTAISGKLPNCIGALFTQDEALVVSAGRDRKVRFHEGESLKEAKLCEGPRSSVSGIAFAPDGKTVATCDEFGTIILWDVESKSDRKRIQLEEGVRLRCIAFSPDSTRVVVGCNDKSTRVMNVNFDDETIKRDDLYANSIAFSPDGKTIAVGTQDGKLVVLSAKNLDVQAERKGHQGRPFKAVAFSPDGTRIATGGMDGGVLLWDLSKVKS